MVEETRCSLALALSFQGKHVSVEMVVGVEGWRKGEKWMKRGIVKSVGSHRIVVRVKRSRLTTHGDCLTSSRLDWSWPAALCSTALDAPMHSPKMHSTVVKAATLVPHARFGQFEFALPPTFPARTRDKPVAYECEARARRSTLDSKRSPIPQFFRERILFSIVPNLSFFPLPCNRSMESYQNYFYEILIFFSSNSYLNFGENWTANLGRCPSLPLFLRSVEIRDAITRLITSVQ